VVANENHTSIILFKLEPLMLYDKGRKLGFKAGPALAFGSNRYVRKPSIAIVSFLTHL